MIHDGHVSSVEQLLEEYANGRRDFANLDLEGESPGNVTLRDADLSRGRFRRANLRGANLDGADLRGADLTGADLSCSSLRRVDFRGADLRDANLSGAVLEEAELSGAKLLATRFLDGADLLNAQGVTLAQLQSSAYDDTTKLPESAHARQKYLVNITKHLVRFTAWGLAILFALSALINVDWSAVASGRFSEVFGSGWRERTYLGVYVFVAGLLGGFVSIQQRLPRIGGDELRELSGSWRAMVLIPLNGGIFALVLYLVFLAGILEGTLFPAFPESRTHEGGAEYLQEWMRGIVPESAPELAKLFFWCFVAGFSERLVPQIIHKTASAENTNETGNST